MELQSAGRSYRKKLVRILHIVTYPLIDILFNRFGQRAQVAIANGNQCRQILLKLVDFDPVKKQVRVLHG